MSETGNLSDFGSVSLPASVNNDDSLVHMDRVSTE